MVTPANQHQQPIDAATMQRLAFENMELNAEQPALSDKERVRRLMAMQNVDPEQNPFNGAGFNHQVPAERPVNIDTMKRAEKVEE